MGKLARMSVFLDQGSIIRLRGNNGRRSQSWHRCQNDHQWIFLEGINSQMINSSSDSRNTIVYFFLYGIHLYPIVARSGSLHKAWLLLDSANFMKKSYTLSANFSAVVTKPLDSIYQAISAMLSATDYLMITSRWPTFWSAFYYEPEPPWWLEFFPACFLALPFFTVPDSFLLAQRHMIYFQLRAYSYLSCLHECTSLPYEFPGSFWAVCREVLLSPRRELIYLCVRFRDCAL